MHTLTKKMCNTVWGLYRQGSISFSSVCVNYNLSQFVLKSITAQQDSLPNTRHSLVVLLVNSNRAITPINFQNPLVKHAVISADTIFGETARDSCASCRKYESTSECLAQAAVTPGKISVVNLTTAFADIHVQCFSYPGVLLRSKLFPHWALQRHDWTTGEPMGGRSAGYLNSPHSAQLNQTTSSDFSNIFPS